MIRSEPKKTDLYLFLVLFAFTSFYFLLATVNNMAAFLETLVFVVMGGLLIGLLAHQKSDDDYYHNLNPLSLAICLIASLGMVGIASLFSVYFMGENLGNTIYTMDLLAPTNSLPTSVLTSFISDVLFTVFLVATVEELLKLAGYTEIKNHPDQIPGAKVLAIIVPVGLWATYHGIQAYNNPIMILPAILNGLILLGLLALTHSFFAPIIAHGAYNAITILLSYIRGQAGLALGMPIFPSKWGTGDIFPVVLALVWTVFIMIPILRRNNE